jgi:hypothetical protein
MIINQAHIRRAGDYTVNWAWINGSTVVVNDVCRRSRLKRRKLLNAPKSARKVGLLKGNSACADFPAATEPTLLRISIISRRLLIIHRSSIFLNEAFSRYRLKALLIFFLMAA